MAGFQVGTEVTHRVLRPLVTAASSQACAVLTLLEGEEEDKARELLRREVDSGLTTLDAIAAERELDQNESRVYQRLREYRQTHSSPTDDQRSNEGTR